MVSVGTFDHDRICGSLFAAFVDRFYKGEPEQENVSKMLAAWDEETHGWVPDAAKKRLTDAMTAWATIYYQRFNPKDGVRNGSEKLVENDTFLGYLDGLSPDEKIIHEVKSTSRAKQTSEQLWKVQHSLQVRLYAVLTKAEGVLIEFAYKDTPHDIFRAPVMEITEAERVGWEAGFNKLAAYIHSLGDDINNYPCNPDGCCITTRNFVSMCKYQSLCDLGFNEFTQIAYKNRESRK